MPLKNMAPSTGQHCRKTCPSAPAPDSAPSCPKTPGHSSPSLPSGSGLPSNGDASGVSFGLAAEVLPLLCSLAGFLPIESACSINLWLSQMDHGKSP